ncbi:stage V sporulation protein AD, partial [Brevibacillus laterosporus]|nr:stage V sporulation protein AD [Brevibacillus laterosporus]
MSTATKSKNRVSQQTWKFTENVRIQGSAVVVGPKEAEGLLKDLFDRTYDDMYAGQDSWEKAEKKLMEDAITLAIKKANLKKNQ